MGNNVGKDVTGFHGKFLMGWLLVTKLENDSKSGVLDQSSCSTGSGSSVDVLTQRASELVRGLSGLFDAFGMGHGSNTLLLNN